MNAANAMGDKSIVELIGADIFSVNSKHYSASDLKGGDAGKTFGKKREEKQPTKENLENGISDKEDRTS
jgi:hypothetical protein